MTHHFNEDDVLHKLRHFLPSQAPLKDFIHHNTLHAFQNFEFYDALRKSAVIFGNRTTLSLREYRDKFAKGEIPEAIVDNVILSSKSKEAFSKWKEQMFSIEEVKTLDPKIGRLRKFWEVDYGIDMDGMVRPNIIRIINSYLDQGIAFEGLP